MIFLALVTFEHDGDDGKILPLDCQGACGWMAVEAHSPTEVARVMRSSLGAVRLKLIETDNVHVVRDAAEAEAHDAHLAKNMRSWQQGCSTVWGTLHCYKYERRSRKPRVGKKHATRRSK